MIGEKIPTRMLDGKLQGCIDGKWEEVGIVHTNLDYEDRGSKRRSSRKDCRIKTLEMTRAHLGAWGELRVQRDLLRYGIDSARMTTDSGIDLVGFWRDGERTRAFSVQVKTRTPKGKAGKLLSWGVKKDKLNAAELFAFVVKSGDNEDIWYIGRQELTSKQRNEYRYLIQRDALVALRVFRGVKPRMGKGNTEEELKKFRGDAGLRRFLGTLSDTSIGR